MNRTGNQTRKINRQRKQLLIKQRSRVTLPNLEVWCSPGAHLLNSWRKRLGWSLCGYQLLLLPTLETARVREQPGELCLWPRSLFPCWKINEYFIMKGPLEKAMVTANRSSRKGGLKLIKPIMFTGLKESFCSCCVTRFSYSHITGKDDSRVLINKYL